MTGIPVPDMIDGGGLGIDRFAAGNGISRDFTNFVALETDYLLWWMNGSRLPPLATSGLTTQTALVPGALNVPTSQVLFGGGTEGPGSHSGHRVRLSLWLDENHAIGVEGSFFFLTQSSTSFSRASSGDPILAVPLFRNGREEAQLLAGDGFAGAVAISLENRLWGTDASLKTNVLSGPYGYLDLLGGFRALGLDEDLSLAASRSGLGRTDIFLDQFDTRNRFWGGQLGVNGEYRLENWTFGVTARVAVGNTNQVVKINGMQLVNGVVANQGIFSGAGNTGRFSQDKLSVVPEAGIKVGYRLSECIRANLGYNFLYWSEVARPGEHIDRTVGGGRPAFQFNSSQFWVHGVTLGLEFRY